MLDIPHDDEECEKVKFAVSICRLKEAYEEYSRKKFDKSLFLKAFEQKDTENKPYIGVLGVRVSGVLEQMIRENIQMNVENLTCTGGRRLAVIPEDLQKMEEEAMFLAYADTLLCQMPCFRMNNSTRRNRLYLDPYLKGIIYHTIIPHVQMRQIQSFCDSVSFREHAVRQAVNGHGFLQHRGC